MCLRCLEINRRALLAGGGIAAASLTTGVAQARIRPADMKPLIGPRYRPTEPDEVGERHRHTTNVTDRRERRPVTHAGGGGGEVKCHAG